MTKKKSIAELVNELCGDVKTLREDLHKLKDAWDFSNGALKHIWSGLVQKYANSLKTAPKRTIAKTIFIVALIHPYAVDVIKDFYDHHIESAVWRNILASFGVL